MFSSYSTVIVMFLLPVCCARMALQSSHIGRYKHMYRPLQARVSTVMSTHIGRCTMTLRMRQHNHWYYFDYNLILYCIKHHFTWLKQTYFLQQHDSNVMFFT